MSVAVRTKMTRKQKIEEALTLLAPERGKRADCRRDIEWMLNHFEDCTRTSANHQAARVKPTKTAIRRYDAALRRLLRYYEALPTVSKPWFAETTTFYERMRLNTEAGFQPSRPSPHAYEKREAVQAARDLLRWWDHKPTITRNGPWATLSAIIFGDEEADLFDHLRSVSKTPGLVINKRNIAPTKERPRGGVAYIGRSTRKSTG